MTSYSLSRHHRSGGSQKLICVTHLSFWYMQASTELKRLVAEEIACGCNESELDECREADLEERLSTLESYRNEAEDRVDPADIRTMSKLGDETRFTILRVLQTADSELCFCELTPLLSLSQSAVSHALADLRNVGLVQRRKDGRWRYYQLTDRAEAILDALDGTR